MNSDGCFVFPVTASSLEVKIRQTLSVIVEMRDFTSELTVRNSSEEPKTMNWEFVSEQIWGDDKKVAFRMELDAGEQQIVPESVEALCREEMGGLGRKWGFCSGPLFVQAKDRDLGGAVIGAGRGGLHPRSLGGRTAAE